MAIKRKEMMYTMISKLAMLFCLVLFITNSAIAQKDTCDAMDAKGLMNIVSIYDNPSYIGVEAPFLVDVSYKVTMPGMDVHPTYLNAGVAASLGKAKNFTLAAMYGLNDQYYDRIQTFYMAASVRFAIDDETEIRLGSTLINFNQHDYNRNRRLYTELSRDPFLDGYPDANKSFLDFGSGLWVKHNRVFMSLSILHWKQIWLDKSPFHYAPSPIPSHINISSGFEWRVATKINLYPSLTLEKNKMEDVMVAITTNMIYNRNILFGLGFKPKQYIQVNTGYYLKEKLGFTLAFGIPVNTDLYQLSPITFYQAGIKFQWN